MKRTLLVLTLCLVAAAARASSGGAPICHVDEITGSPMGNPVAAANPFFPISVTPAAYTVGQPLSFQIQAGDMLSVFHGLLIYVEDPDDQAEDGQPRKVGLFEALPAWLQAKPECVADGLSRVLTHVDGQVDKIAPVSISWTAPPIELGTLRLRAIVLKKGGSIQTAPYKIYSIQIPSADDLFANQFE